MPVVWDKLEGQASKLTFVGLKLNTVKWEVCLPMGKLREIQRLIQTWSSRKRSCTIKELELLVGRLTHASHVVTPGKTFMHCLFKLLPDTRRLTIMYN